MTLPTRLAPVLLALLLPAAVPALEPRYDHRDQQGALLALETWRETVVVSGVRTRSDFRPRLRAGWGFDLSGEGDELILSATTRIDSWEDPEAMRFLYGLDARYRGYFGTEELKTFFEVGVWSELKSRFAVGPAVGLGVAYDPNRRWGAFFSVHFATGFGEARIASFGASAGVQLRY
jgi:hypothetical protein